MKSCDSWSRGIALADSQPKQSRGLGSKLIVLAGIPATA